jgi:hypothetical protein
MCWALVVKLDYLLVLHFPMNLTQYPLLNFTM